MSQAIPHSNIQSHNFMELFKLFFDNNHFDILSLGVSNDRVNCD